MAGTLKSHFLVAGKRLRDPNFFKGVVLVLEHGENGAMGIVVNRPTSILVSNALAGHFEIPNAGDLVHQGGPVEPNGLFILHNSGDLDDEAVEVMPGLFVGSSADVFEQVVKRAAEGEKRIKFRVFSGCAGWAPDQLENELSRADWYVVPANVEAVFSNDPYGIWEEQLQQAQKASSVLKRFKGDPGMN